MNSGLVHVFHKVMFIILFSLLVSGNFYNGVPPGPRFGPGPGGMFPGGGGPGGYNRPYGNGYGNGMGRPTPPHMMQQDMGPRGGPRGPVSWSCIFSYHSSVSKGGADCF